MQPLLPVVYFKIDITLLEQLLEMIIIGVFTS